MTVHEQLTAIREIIATIERSPDMQNALTAASPALALAVEGQLAEAAERLEALLAGIRVAADAVWSVAAEQGHIAAAFSVGAGPDGVPVLDLAAFERDVVDRCRVFLVDEAVSQEAEGRRGRAQALRELAARLSKDGLPA